MKLFHWMEIQALRDYGAGQVIIMAESLEEAHMSAIRDLPDHVAEEVLRTSPEVVHSSSYAIGIMGSA